LIDYEIVSEKLPMGWVGTGLTTSGLYARKFSQYVPLDKPEQAISIISAVFLALGRKVSWDERRPLNDLLNQVFNRSICGVTPAFRGVAPLRIIKGRDSAGKRMHRHLWGQVSQSYLASEAIANKMKAGSDLDAEDVEAVLDQYGLKV
jgi:hypothetical protein